MQDVVDFYNNTDGVDVHQWESVLTEYLDIHDNRIINKVCIFAGKYSKLEQHLTVDIFSLPNRTFDYPDWFYPMKTALSMIRSSINDNVRIPIKRDYYNIIKNVKGVELENGVCIENGSVVKDSNYDKYISNLEDIIEDEIRYIIDIPYRKVRLRKQKLNEINQTI
jgi:hypothetical protein